MRKFAKLGCVTLNNFKGIKVIQHRLIFISTVQARPCLQLEWEAPRETIFTHLNQSQQKRDYTLEKSTNCRDCWNCKKAHSTKNVLLQCEHCGFLQDVKPDINYFDLLDFPPKFDLDARELTKRFRNLQTVVHPDKFSNKTSREQANSGDWSSLINKAYKTLLMPLERGQYLLELNGLLMPQDNSALDKEFLMEMMERNEEVENAMTSKELNAINDRLVQELKEKENSLAKTFFENNLEISKQLLIEMKYLISIQRTIKNKLQTFLVH